jgi:hypothetical protein
MKTQTGSMRLQDILEARRARRAQTAERRRLARELAVYTSAGDRNDLDAILARHTEEEAAGIRHILTGQRAA